METGEPAATQSRKNLGISDDDVVFVNAASCFKILPELQETWAKIIKAVPNSRLLLLPFNPNWASKFPEKQFQRSLTETFSRHGLSSDRFILAKSLHTRAEVKALENVADIYLDTFPFSGSISIIDPLELCIPPIVWQGQTHRSRMAAALLRELDLTDLIVEDEPDYIALAVKMSSNKSLRNNISKRIYSAMMLKPKFINPTKYIRELEVTLVSALTSVEGNG